MSETIQVKSEGPPPPFPETLLDRLRPLLCKEGEGVYRSESARVNEGTGLQEYRTVNQGPQSNQTIIWSV